MVVLVAVPFAIGMAGISVGWRIRSRRGDEKSIEAHRSALGVIEHVAGADDLSGSTRAGSRASDPSRSHVRIIGGPPGARPEPSHDDAVLPGCPPRRTDRLCFPLQAVPVPAMPLDLSLTGPARA